MEALQKPLREVLTRYPEVQLCIVFGSGARGAVPPGSDLDIAVAATRPLSADRRLALVEAFSAATGREIDLVDLMAASGPIVRQALSKGVVIQNREKGLYARLISRMLLDQADMMPLHDRILQERRRRFLNG